MGGPDHMCDYRIGRITVSYDLFCYHSELGKPELEEAQSAVEAAQQAEEDETSLPPLTQACENLAAALLRFDPRLERFVFDYAEIAKTQGISEELARSQCQCIELSPQESDLAEGALVVQVTIYPSQVSLTIPYWYQDKAAIKVFEKILGYLKVIRQQSGYFAYDSQIDKAFDPAAMQSLDHRQYKKVMGKMPEILANAEGKPAKRWWKFWK